MASPPGPCGNMASPPEADLFKSVGGFGRYQKIQLVIVCMISFFGAELLYNNFILYTPDHWCNVNKLNGYGNLSVEELKNLTIPFDETTGTYSSCEMYNHNYHNSSGVSKARNSASLTTCNSWHFDDSEYSNTVVTKWQLVCGKAWWVDMLSSIHVFGFLVGAMACGPISDGIGRWKATVICETVKIIGVIMSLFAPNFPFFVAARFVIGLGALSTYMATFVLVIETTSPGYRTLTGAILGAAFAFGCMFLSGLAYVERDWRRIQLASVIPNIIIMISILYFLQESPRWLLQKGHTEKGLKVLKRIGEINKQPFFEKVATSYIHKAEEVDSDVKKKPSLFKLFVTPLMRKCTLVCLVGWCTCSFIYYALSLNARSLSGNIFVNFFLLSAVEIPATLAAFLCLRSRILGRKGTSIIAYFIAGIASLVSVPLIVYYGKSYTTTALAIIGKAGASVAFTAIYIYTSELFPTEIRNLALGVGCVSARVGAILAPYAGGSLGKVWAPLPSLLFGITGTVAGSLILLLPETREKVLKDTVEEEEETNK